MSIKVEPNFPVNKVSRPFPKLVITDQGVIAYLKDDHSGIVIYSKYNKFGYEIKDWTGANWEDYEGEIILKNER